MPPHKTKHSSFFLAPEFLSLLFALFLVLLIAVFSYRSWFAFYVSSADLELTQRVIDGTDQLLALLKNAETGQRGFLLTRARSVSCALPASAYPSAGCFAHS